MTKRKRDYDAEYKAFHALPEQKKRRAQRNKARRESGLSVGDSREVHHQNAPRKGSLEGSKTRIVSKKYNRKIQPKRS